MAYYAFKYLEGGGEEREVGPFKNKKSAKKSREKMQRLGAKCTDIYPYPRDASAGIRTNVPGKDYAGGLVEKFEGYLARELAVLNGGVGYEIVYSYLDELSNRITRFVRYHEPKIKKKKGVPMSVVNQTDLYKARYLQGVAYVLRWQAGQYSPLFGSVPEDIGKLLRKLAGSFEKE